MSGLEKHPWMQAYMQKHAKSIDWQRKYRKEHREAIRASQRKYYEEHREEINARRLKYYEEHREEINARRREARRKKKEAKLRENPQ